MPEFTFKIAMDCRTYGRLTVEAETAESALASITAEMCSDLEKMEIEETTFDYPADIYVFETCVNEDGDDVFTGDRDIPNGDWIKDDPVKDAAPDLLAALKLLTMHVAAMRADESVDAVNFGDAGGILFGDLMSEAIELAETTIAAAEGNAPAPADDGLNWYVVTGRVSGDDEDSAEVIRAANTDDAMAEFRRTLIEGGNYGDDVPEIFINTIANCGKHEPKLEA